MPLTGLSVAVDVQHLFRSGIHRGDRGSVYTLANGRTLAEGDCTLQYAASLARELEARGANVITNEPAGAILTGPYSRRQRAAMNFGAALYLACHLNAGGGDYALVEYAEESPHAWGAMRAGRAILAALRSSFSEVKGVALRSLRAGDRGHVCVAGFTDAPALILEPLFGDRPEHQGLLDFAGLARVGRAIARGITDWRAVE